ncbi:hypothetical protein BDDG_05523 [Blastomyces dermatitidis ATCC 18188]|uniref:Uncharacterized protein n=1 Tax=Ajellomyces dermatitidis (strain ATCC 18188 / CBS 674.68) TaxID=653446 RepID=F2TH66_AJEDA|nr:hypothetical protein BDDG_05523 [Blastomyces dermatitidis ATCC 18188]
MDMAKLYAAINGPSEVIPTSLRDSDSESNLMKAQKDQKQITILYLLPGKENYFPSGMSR